MASVASSEDDADNYSDNSNGGGGGSESESDDGEDDDDDEQPLKPDKILARKTLKPPEWREMCKDMNTDQAGGTLI